MATIRPNDNAPAESVKYVFPLETFDLAPGGDYNTENRDTLAAAAVHPWLEVEYPSYEEFGVDRASSSVPYSEDVLAAVNSKAFDEEAIRASFQEREEVAESRLAIEAGLDQGEPVERGGVAVTIAADEETSTDDNDQEDKA